MLGQRVIISSDGLALSYSIFLSFKIGKVLLVWSIAGNTAKVTLETETSTLFATVRPVWLMLLMGVFALAAGPPFVDVKIFASWQPVHAYLLWSARNESKLLAVALGAGLVFVLMTGQKVAAKAFRI